MLIIDNLDLKLFVLVLRMLPFYTYIKCKEFNKIEYNSSAIEHMDMTAVASIWLKGRSARHIFWYFYYKKGSGFH
jgi:hypothetical protein